MKISISKIELFTALQKVIGAVERKQTHEVMGNLLFMANDDHVSVIGSDFEVEIKTTIPLVVDQAGQTTIPARKLFEICKTLNDDARIDIDATTEKVKVKAGKSRFTLASLPADDFPVVDEFTDGVVVPMLESVFSKAIKRTSFAMANQDVRYYLNGMHLNCTGSALSFVTADGHRLAVHRSEVESVPINAVIPRKSIAQILRVMGEGQETVRLALNESHARVVVGDTQITTSLIQGKYPEYERVIPSGAMSIAICDRDELLASLGRSSILANETYKGIRLCFDKDQLEIQTNNPRFEESTDQIDIQYNGDPVEIGFNVVYMIDALKAIESETVEIHIGDSSSSIIIHPGDDRSSTYVVMPMRL